MSARVTSVPLLDLSAQYQQVGKALEERVLTVLRSGHYILGKNLSELEEQVAALCGTSHGIGCANGTDALVLALWAANVGPGDEVITPPFTFAATAEAAAIRGATPVFVDVDPTTFNLDPRLLEAKITPRTKCIIPVHLYGQPADMDPIMAIADRFGLVVIEDNAQALGASYKGRPTGGLAHMSCTSFYPTKNLGACGDAGMVLTDDDELAARLRRLRAHGMQQRYFHEELGVNSRLDEIQAAALLTKLPFLQEWNEKRAQVARWYEKAFKGAAGIICPQPLLRTTHVYHQYTVRLSTSSGRGPASGAALDRDAVIKELSACGIGSMIYYPVPLHLQKAFAGLGYGRGDFPYSEAVSREVLSLPMYPELSEAQVQYVAQNLTRIVNEQLAAATLTTIPVNSTPAL